MSYEFEKFVKPIRHDDEYETRGDWACDGSWDALNIFRQSRIHSDFGKQVQEELFVKEKPE